MDPDPRRAHCSLPMKAEPLFEPAISAPERLSVLLGMPAFEPAFQHLTA